MQQPICSHLETIRGEIAHQVTISGRPAHSVKLLAVSKTKPIEDIKTAISCGQRFFGENYAQELQEKSLVIGMDTVEWHFIGPLQSNKTRIVAEHAHWVHTIDRLKIAQRLSRQRPNKMPSLQVCLQINIDEEESKSGISLDELPALAHKISQLPNITLRGLMCIPLKATDQKQQHASFALLRKALEQLNDQGYSVDTLSMGMSNDFPIAIEEGSTMVRIGTAIFGGRS